MDEARFRAILQAYGAEPRRWPAAERAAAEQLAATPAGRAACAEAAALDAALDAAVPAAPSDLLARRILAAAPRIAPLPRYVSGALAAALVVGVLIGMSGASALRDRDEADALISASFEAPAFLDLPGADG